jgi:UDP-glucose 4-epimerase
MTQKRNILILGGAGFIGRSLTCRLASNGHVVTQVDTSAIATDIGNVTQIIADLADADTLAPLLRGCDTVVHLASATTPSSSATHPLLEGEHNILPMLRLLELMQADPPPHMMFISSGGTVYGDPPQLPATEATLLAPHSYHAAGKIALEAFFNTYRHLSRSTVTVLRPSNIYGPRQPLRSGFGLVRNILENVLHGQAVTVWGDGEHVRDYLYVDDMVSACQQLIESGGSNGTFNVGAGTGTSINTLLRIIENICGMPVRVEYHPPRTMDVRSIVLDCTKLYDAIGWQPQIDLKEGISRTWQWMNTL